MQDYLGTIQSLWLSTLRDYVNWVPCSVDSEERNMCESCEGNRMSTRFSRGCFGGNIIT